MSITNTQRRIAKLNLSDARFDGLKVQLEKVAERIVEVDSGSNHKLKIIELRFVIEIFAQLLLKHRLVQIHDTYSHGRAGEVVRKYGKEILLLENAQLDGLLDLKNPGGHYHHEGYARPLWEGALDTAVDLIYEWRKSLPENVYGPPLLENDASNSIKTGSVDTDVLNKRSIDFARDDVCSLFDTTLPTIGRSEYEVSEKYILYGGRPISLSIGYRAINHAVAGHSFDRSLVYNLALLLREPSVGVKSYTIKSLPGAGLSLSLAQLVRDLSTDEYRKLFWVIDKPDVTCKLVSTISASTADRIYSEIRQKSPRTTQIVVIIDDLSRVPPRHIINLITFRERFKHLTESQTGPQVTFVFGSFGAARTCHEDQPFPLDLTPEDQNQCYAQMANASPKLILGLPGGLSEILRSHPDARLFMDDAQAFIDFLLEFGQPTSAAIRHWLARTEGIKDMDLSILTTTAVAQLIGLPLEESVARRLFSSHYSDPLDHLELVVEKIQGLALISEPWNGLGLSCARRAKSILQRTSKLTFDYLYKTYSTFILDSLDQFNARGNAAAAPIEFARHIFQRLSKDPLYKFDEKKLIAESLLFAHLEAISAISNRFNVTEMARWAGTISAVIRPKKDVGIEQTPHLTAAMELVCSLCESSIQQIKDIDDELTPEIAVGLYRACLRLLSFAPRNIRISSKNPQICRILRVCTQLQYAFNMDRIMQVIQHQLLRKAENVAYRCNELVHVQANFEDAMHNKWDRSYSDMMSKWYSKVDALLQASNVKLDAANWLKRSYCVRESAVEQRAQFLEQAVFCIRSDPYGQGTWTEDVEETVRRFVNMHPAYAKRFQ